MAHDGQSYTGFDHVGMSAADADSLAAWYGDVAGLEEEMRFTYAVDDRGDIQVVILRHPDGYRLEFQQKPGSVPNRPADPFDALTRQSITHLCFKVRDIDAAFERFVAAGAGVCFSVIDSPIPGVRVAYLTDPEGNLVELLERKDE